VSGLLSRVRAMSAEPEMRSSKGQGRRQFLLVFLAIAFACFLLAAVASRAEAAPGGPSSVVVNFDVPVDPGSSSLMADAVATAESSHAPAIVIEMNTPGGLLSDMLDIVTSIEQANQSGIPTYTYVPPNGLAASAGSYIAMATNGILMGSGSEIGPSTPIVEGGTALEQNHTEDAMISLMVSLAEKWGRNSTAAQSMVVSDVAFSAAQAYQYHLTEGNASSLQGALSQFGLGPDYTVVQEGAYDQLLSALSDPNLYGILILLGAFAIVLDLTHPTFILSIAGAIALVAGLVGAEVVGSSLLGIVVILIGVGLMFLELWQGHGLAMMGGALVGAVGVYLLFQGVQVSSSTLIDFTQVEAVGVGAIGVLGGLYFRWIVGPMRHKRNLTGSESLIGKRGVAVSPTEVRVEGIIWRARIDSGELKQGEQVQVKAVEDLVLRVVRVEENRALDAM
jgi:membrane-bound serine protease (ClpP class)